MSQEGSTAGFEQASADAARLASELAEIRKQLTELRKQNAKFLATDPVTGKRAAEAPSTPSASGQPAAKQAVAKTIGANAKAPEPQMAAAARSGPTAPAGAAASTSDTTPSADQTRAPASEPESTSDEAESGRKRWWKKQKPEGKDTGF